MCVCVSPGFSPEMSGGATPGTRPASQPVPFGRPGTRAPLIRGGAGAADRPVGSTGVRFLGCVGGSQRRARQEGGEANNKQTSAGQEGLSLAEAWESGAEAEAVPRPTGVVGSCPIRGQNPST